MPQKAAPKFTTIAITLLTASILAVPAWAAFVEQDGSIILSDNFEEIPDTPTNLYQIGDSPVVQGPWTGNSNTSAQNNNNYIEIAARPDGQTGQAANYLGRFATYTELKYHDNSNNRPTEYFYEFQWLPQPSTRSETDQHNYVMLQDSNQAKGVLYMEAVKVTPAEGDPYNELVLVNGDGQTNFGAISSTEFTQIHLHIAPGEETGDPWTYSLWINGDQKVDNQLFTLNSSEAVKADVLVFKSKWQGSGQSYVDNFSQRTDHFATPVPDPATLSLLLAGGVLMLTRRQA